MMLRALVHVAAMDRGTATPKKLRNALLSAFVAIDDEQPGQRRIEPPG